MASNEDEHDRLARRLAFYGVLFTGVIGLGISFISIGGTLIISVVPQLHDAIIEAENNGTNLNKIQEKNLTDKFNVILWEANNSTFYIVGGSILIVLGVINSYIYMIRRRPLRHHTPAQVNDLDASIMMKSSDSEDYTGKKYFATRKRLSYHPPDKMFPNETYEPNDAKKEVPNEAPTKPRGTLPKGF